MTRILVVDNYDSFVYTIVGYLDQIGARTVVVRNDAVPSPDADGRYWYDDGDGSPAPYDGVLVSPGPGTPAEAGASEGALFLDASHSHPELRGANRPHVASRTSSKYDQIVRIVA